MENVPTNIPTVATPIPPINEKVTKNIVQKSSRRRLFVLICILFLLLFVTLFTFIYLEAQNRSYLKTQFEESRYSEVLESPYIPYRFVSPSPAMYSSPVTVSPGKHFLAENDRYSVYLNAKGGTLELEGTLTIEDKQTDKVITIEDNFVIFGKPSIFQSPDMKYLVVDTGTYIFRGADIISLEKGRKVASFCNWGGKVYFWNDFAVYTGCDTNPANDNEKETNVEAISLLNQEQKVLFTANETGSINSFKITSISASILEVEETYVHASEDWLSGDESKLFTRAHTLDLNRYLK